MVLQLSLLTTVLPALGRLSPQTPPAHAYFHLTGALLVTLSTRHIFQISISWSFSRFLPLTAVQVPFGPKKRVFVETENTQTLSFINKGTCKNPIAMSWLREIFWLRVRHNFHLRERHLPGRYNRQADRLSRPIQSASFSNHGSFPILRISHAAGPSNLVCVSRGVCKFYAKNASHNGVLTYGYSLLTN